MNSPVFYGQHLVSLDSKNRMLVPAAVRDRLDQQVHGDGFFMVTGTNNRPWLFPSLYYEFLARQDKPALITVKDISDFDRFNFSIADLLKLDAQGRLLIPSDTLEWMGMQSTSKLYLLGARDHLELWPQSDWETERESMRARTPELAERARKARETQ